VLLGVKRAPVQSLKWSGLLIFNAATITAPGLPAYDNRDMIRKVEDRSENAAIQAKRVRNSVGRGCGDYCRHRLGREPVSGGSGLCAAAPANMKAYMVDVVGPRHSRSGMAAMPIK